MSDQVNIFNLYLENAANQEPVMRIDADGTKEWYLHDKLHRENAPAIEWADGTKEWWLHGVRHRKDAPAIEWADGTKMWYSHGKRHREDGPAYEYGDGTKAWWLNGKHYDDAEQWAETVLKMHNKPATPDDVQRFLRSIYKKKSLL